MLIKKDGLTVRKMFFYGFACLIGFGSFTLFGCGKPPAVSDGGPSGGSMNLQYDCMVGGWDFQAFNGGAHIKSSFKSGIGSTVYILRGATNLQGQDLDFNDVKRYADEHRPQSGTYNMYLLGLANVTNTTYLGLTWNKAGSDPPNCEGPFSWSAVFKGNIDNLYGNPPFKFDLGDEKQDTLPLVSELIAIHELGHQRANLPHNNASNLHPLYPDPMTDDAHMADFIVTRTRSYWVFTDKWYTFCVNCCRQLRLRNW